MTIEREFTIKDVNSGQVFKEVWKAPENENIREYAESIIKSWNETEKERYGDKGQPRELISIGDETGNIFCSFRKLNKMTIIKNGKNYDVICCPKCKIVEKRYGLNPSPIDRRCYPKTTCTDCNRTFKTQTGYYNHQVKGKHRLAAWMPDGV